MKEKRFMMSLREADHVPGRNNDYVKDGVLMSKLAEKEAEYAELFAHPYNAASRGYVDEVILPRNTREKLIQGMAMLKNKAVKTPRKKHSNIPL